MEYTPLKFIEHTPNFMDEDRRTPLWHACHTRMPDLDIIAELLEREDVNHADRFGTTPLASLFYGTPEIQEVCKLLLQHGADTNQPDRLGWTPFMQACRQGDNACVYMMILHGADLYKEDRYHRNAILHIAALPRCKRRQEDDIEAFIKKEIYQRQFWHLVIIGACSDYGKRLPIVILKEIMVYL